jgi:hypothetical protein
MIATKLDWKKDLKTLYAPPKNVVEVVVPPMNYLMIDGKGNPNTSLQFQQATEALYSLSYTLKFAQKKQGIEYAVFPLEGLWWMEDMSDLNPAMPYLDKDRFIWTLMIAQPEGITGEMVEQVREEVRKKKNPAALNQVRFETYDEGACVQIMHIGSYDDEAPNIQKLHDYIETHGWHLRPKHHEIYLSDFRRTAPDKLKTVIRQPYSK